MCEFCNNPVSYINSGLLLYCHLSDVTITVGDSHLKLTQDDGEAGSCDDVVLSAIDIDVVFQSYDRGAELSDLPRFVLPLLRSCRKFEGDGKVGGRRRSGGRRLEESRGDEPRGRDRLGQS